MSSDDVTRRERTISGALALAMHLIFIVLLVVGVSWQSKRSVEPIAVELWSELPPAPRPKPEPAPPPPPPEPPRQAPRPQPRPEPKPEVKPVPKPDIALKEQLLKKRQQEEKERAEREEKERQQKLVQEKLERERKQKEEEARKRREKELAEKKREEEKRLAEKKKQEEAKKLAELKRQEDAKRKEQEMQAMLRKQAQQAAEAEARSRLDAYSRLVADKIKRYMVEPPNMQGKPEAVFEVVQIPGGEILSVRLKRSSGNPAYDAAAERAIRKAQPLPPPPDPARFSEVRELELIVRPEGK